MMKYLQKLGKALMLPVACLPICGILMGIGYALAPAAMALLFVIGVGVGMADDNDGTAALAALASWLMMTTLLSTGVVGTLMTLEEGTAKFIAFQKIENPFIGILAGIIGATCYNKFKGTKLPNFLAFFSGKRCVAIIAGVVSIVVSAILLFVWPIIFGGLVSIGQSIVKLDAVGAGIYAFLNRLLIPTGLHHALNNVFWFDTIGLVGSAAFCAFLCGVTEPFEFGFMFLAPGLYVVYALLYGIFVTVTTLLGFRAGFSFSAGATDLLFSASLPAAEKTWMIIPLGIAAFIIFYVVFRFAITKFNLKTPGREDDDTDETKVVLANNDFTEVARIVLEGLGGKENITSIDNCITRLRLEIKDNTLVDESVIKSAGVAGVIRPGKTSVQVIIGTQVQHVADEFKKLCK